MDVLLGGFQVAMSGKTGDLVEIPTGSSQIG
jgi:hypothetical protein